MAWPTGRQRCRPTTPIATAGGVAVRIYFEVRGVMAHVDLAGSWPSVSALTALAEALVRTTRECPSCPDVPASAFLEALAAAVLLEIASDLLKTAADWP
jgi:hypothetical protein